MKNIDEWCVGTTSFEASEVLFWTQTLNHIMLENDQFEDIPGWDTAVLESTEKAAKILEKTCIEAADYTDPDSYGGALLHNLRGWLLLRDGDSERALADLPNHKQLWDKHKVAFIYFLSVSASMLPSFALWVSGPARK